MDFLPLTPLLDSLRDRRVAVVGNASSLLTQAHGQAIDDHECVIRFNRGFMVQSPAALGSRMDIWALGARQDVKTLDAIETHRPVTAVWARTPDCAARRHFEAHARGRWPELVLYDPALREQITQALENTRPTTGLLMIAALVLRSQASQIDVYGFDFFASPSLRGNPEAPHVFHAPERERQLFETYLAKDSRLRWVKA